MKKKKKEKKKKDKNVRRTSKKEMEHLNEMLIQLNEKLVESEQMKSHFISNISNEILNPFTAILGLSRNILEVKRENWKKVISMVAMIHSEAFNLDFQLKNIFAAARLEAGEVNPEISKVDLRALVKDVVETFKYEALKKSLEIKCRFSTDKRDKSCYFLSDSEKIRLILSNLLSNAIKYSYEQGLIQVNVAVKKNWLSLQVRDSGEGVSKENIQIIFDRFNRKDSGINSNLRGHGLGLSINKAFVDILKGSITVKTAAGKGTIFTVVLPAAKGGSKGTTLEGNELLFNEDQF